MGFDHPQWEMWSASKHGVRYLLTQNGTLPEGTPAPTCQNDLTGAWRTRPRRQPDGPARCRQGCRCRQADTGGFRPRA
jgi:hypothetical protein